MTIPLLVLAAALWNSVVVLPPEAVQFDLSGYLRLLEEEPLESWPPEQRTFRFMWVSAFDSQRIISVRVFRTGEGPELVATAAKRGGAVDARLQRSLTDAEWENLREKRQAGFWTFRPDEYPRRGFADGSTWVLEGSAAGERLRVVQHIPKAGAFVDLCCEMFLLSGIRLAEPERSAGISRCRPTKR
jgi:hypothetical protein